jgi:SAM-dependent methyltransferase
MRQLPSLELSTSWEQEIRLIESAIKGTSIADGALKILEAGCGQRWNLNLEGVEYVLTGVDLDSDALDIRKNVLKDLHEAFVGDLRTINFDSGRFDVIYNSFVLEHIQGAEIVLKSFVRWLKPGGLIILRIPDPDSVKGFITRITPHWFHVFYYRYFLKVKTAGLPGHGPYRTYFDSVVSRSGLYEFCKKNDLSIKAEYGDGYMTVPFSIKFISKVIGLFSLGKFSARHCDLLYVLQLDKKSA